MDHGRFESHLRRSLELADGPVRIVHRDHGGADQTLGIERDELAEPIVVNARGIPNHVAVVGPIARVQYREAQGRVEDFRFDAGLVLKLDARGGIEARVRGPRLRGFVPLLLETSVLFAREKKRPWCSLERLHHARSILAVLALERIDPKIGWLQGVRIRADDALHPAILPHAQRFATAAAGIVGGT